MARKDKEPAWVTPEIRMLRKLTRSHHYSICQCGACEAFRDALRKVAP